MRMCCMARWWWVSSPELVLVLGCGCGCDEGVSDGLTNSTVVLVSMRYNCAVVEAGVIVVILGSISTTRSVSSCPNHVIGRRMPMDTSIERSEEMATMRRAESREQDESV